MTFTTLDIYDKDVLQFRNWPNLVFIKNIAVTQLATITSSPREHHSLIIQSCSVIVS